MTNSEDTTTGDNLSTINNSASKVNDSFSSGGSAHPSQLAETTQKDCGNEDVNKVNGSGSSSGDVWCNGGVDGKVTAVQQRLEESCSTSRSVSSSTFNSQEGQLQTTDAILQASILPQLPFRLICGEILEYKCDTTEGVLALTNYRLFIKGKNTNFNIPIGVIEQVENRDIFFLHVSGKDARCIRCTFPNNDTATETMKRIQTAISSFKNMNDTFAYTFYKTSQDETSEEISAQLGLDLQDFPSAKERFDMEIKRMEFNVQGPWRISDENKDYELCGSYPTHIIVPSNMTKKQLEMVACFRSARRIPAVVWRHRGNGAVISRCSQPEVGWFGWRSAEDEELVQNIVMACADNSKSYGSELTTKQPERIKMDSESGEENTSLDAHNSSLLSMEYVPDPPNTKKLLIIDARSYTTAVANRARGGGCECLEYYPRCEIQFMNLANIHSIRKSFINVRQLCTMTSDQSNSWYSQLESCKWLQHMSGLMKAATTVVSAIEEEGRPVMVHCSDGWDRTPQIVALSEILLDPYYRSLEGFQILVEREWLDFGHKFADRCGQPLGSEDANERCPVFLQWLDCLHQLIRQFPTAFEFNLTFLVKLAQHTYSNLFGTFLFNTSKERHSCDVERDTHSVWRFLRAPANASKFRNNLYLNCDKVLLPSCEVRELVLWTQVYLGYENPPSHTTEILNPSQESSPAPSVAADCEMNDRMNACKSLNKSKTRSCEDLHSPYIGGLQRRQSDPNLSDSFHAGDPLDDAIESVDDSVPLRQSTPKKKSLDPVNTSEVLTRREYTDSSTGIGRFTNFEDSENDDTEPNSESKSESTVVSISHLDQKSVESSTDTLVSDMVVGGLLDAGGGEVVGRKIIRGDRVLSKTDAPRTCESDPVEGQDGKTDYVNTTNNLGLLETANNAPMKRRDDGAETVSKHNNGGFVNVVPPCDDTNGGRTRLKSFTADFHNFDALMVEDGIPESSLPVHCEVCETSRRLLGESVTLLSSCVQGNANSSSNNNNMTSTSSVISPSNPLPGDASRISSYNTPMHSRTPSTGVPVTPDDQGTLIKLVGERQLQETTLGALSCSTTVRSGFDVDGLSSLHDEVQNRLTSIVFGYRSQIEILQKELQLTRDALMKQVCHTCTHHVSDRPDDVASVGDSLASCEHQSVGHDSQSSEISWEAVDEKDTRQTLWIPDYAVHNCMGCDAGFWIGRRKHHCRSCGKIFCNQCSPRTITIPSEQFFTPVRVCISCFQRLASHSSENVPGPYRKSTTNGNLVSSTGDDPSILVPQQNNSHCRGNVQNANQNGCDHSKTPGCFSSYSTGQPCPSNVTNTVPSTQKDLNHSKFQQSVNATISNGVTLSPFETSSVRSEQRKNNPQQFYPAVHASKMPRNPTCKQQSTSSSNNDLQNHHATVTKGN